MNRILLILALLSLVIISCKKPQQLLQDKKESDFEKAEAFAFKNNDSAFYYFNKVVTSSSDRMDIATSYNYMAAIQDDAGDYYGAQESVTSSLKYLDEKNSKHFSIISSDYNELGVSNFNLKRYDLALRYYDLASKFCDDEAVKPLVLNNKATVYLKTGDYLRAIRIYEQIMPQYKDHPKEYARALSNLSKTKWLLNPNYNAAPQLLKALNMRKNAEDNWGQNASYAHLSDYYTLKQADSALYYAKHMYKVATRLKSPDDQLEALEKLIKLSPSVDIKSYFQTYQKLSDSVQTARNAAKNQFAVIRYESEKSKAENLVLQQENTEKKYQILIRELLLGAGIVSILILSVFAVFWDKKRKQKMELETENTVKESQLKTSKRVHDVVANGLYRVMTEIENQDHIDRELILDKIEDLYEKSRDISYESPLPAKQDFHHIVSELLKSFGTADTKILIAGNTTELWQKVNPVIRYEVEPILQELMVNMKKHSQAKNVVLKFESKGKEIIINYKDDGIGLAKGHAVNNGLRNTGNRIDFIKGAITFDTNLEKGLNVRISFPHA